ncbi:Uma2 family endonuclease [Sporosarcina limicola]|uniref:Uma2 family endonuclease n=1 Tax=Sporosarcina limicola TaxID=34101 RepID=A0A927MG95_9BACL|nr:Uma2 family endonuclease [Sporosarcina limicola]MBE1553221.1 Uma2 family endonuclease [Sporosarcina limicola]
MAQSKSNQRFTITEINTWDGSWELIDGVPYNMTPAPSPLHQRIVGELFFELRTHFGSSGCAVYVAPFDVQVDKADDYTIVQPDISVICDESQVGTKRAIGAPELIIEVLSPSTALKDRNNKFNLYERTGVKEYWLVDPYNETIEVYGVSGGRYRKRKVFGRDDSLLSFVFPDLRVELSAVFAD